MIEQGLYQLLTNDAAVSALVGTKAYWILAPKGAVLPYLVLSRVGTSDVYDFDGASGFRDGLFQVACFSTDYYGSKIIANAVRAVLEDFMGNMPDTDSTAVAAVFTEKDWDDQYEEGGKGFVYCNYLQFRIWHYDQTVAVPIDGGNF